MSIEAAIAKAAAPPPRAGVKIQLTTGREALLNVPADLSAQEAIDLVGYIATQLPGTLAKAGRPASARLLVPSRMVGRG